MLKITLITLMFIGFSSESNAETGLLSGDNTSGLNKVCYYNAPSGRFSTTIGSAQLCPLSADNGIGHSYSSTNNSGFLSGQNTSGLNKTCYYNSPEVPSQKQSVPLNCVHKTQNNKGE